MFVHTSERGQGTVEYVLLLALISIVVIAALSMLGHSLGTVFYGIAEALQFGCGEVSKQTFRSYAGEGGIANLAEAVRRLQTAAERGHAGAHRELAFFYDEGRGVARSPERAAEHLLAALAGGHKDAERELVERPGAWSYSTRRALQRALARRGLYRGAAHGIFNKSTRRALQQVASGD